MSDLTVKVLVEGIENAIEGSEMLLDHAPVALLPYTLDLGEREFWTPEEEGILMEALSQYFGIAISALKNAHPGARSIMLGTGDSKGNIVYVQEPEGHRVFSVGLPGFGFGDEI